MATRDTSTTMTTCNKDINHIRLFSVISLVMLEKKGHKGNRTQMKKGGKIGRDKMI